MPRRHVWLRYGRARQLCAAGDVGRQNLRPARTCPLVCPRTGPYRIGSHLGRALYEGFWASPTVGAHTEVDLIGLYAYTGARYLKGLTCVDFVARPLTRPGAQARGADGHCQSSI
jgi:hypothetical protein